MVADDNYSKICSPKGQSELFRYGSPLVLYYTNIKSKE
jgi:hypothetical protein